MADTEDVEKMYRGWGAGSSLALYGGDCVCRKRDAPVWAARLDTCTCTAENISAYR